MSQPKVSDKDLKEAEIKKLLDKCQLETSHPGFEQRMKNFFEKTKHMSSVKSEEIDQSDLEESQLQVPNEMDDTHFSQTSV